MDGQTIEMFTHIPVFSNTPVILDSPVRTAYYKKHQPWSDWWGKADRHLFKTSAMKKGESFRSFQNKRDHKEGFSNKAFQKYLLEQWNFAEYKGKQ